MATKKYFWLKLKDDFFREKEIKKLRKIAGGDTYTIIYLKMLLLSLGKEGRLYFDGIEDSFAEEVALEIDEDVENVKVTVLFLKKCNLLEELSENEFMLIQAANNIGSETQGAERVRRFRESQKALLCNTCATNCNTEIEIEIEKDIDKDKEKDIKQKPKKNPAHQYGEYKNVLLNVNKKTQSKVNKSIVNNTIIATKLDVTDNQELKEALEKFIEHRVKIKKPLTDYAFDLMIKNLNDLSNDPKEQIKILEQSMINGWVGIFELKGGEKQSYGTRSNNTANTRKSNEYGKSPSNKNFEGDYL